MAIIVKWFNEEKTIASYCLQGHWTWDDLYAAVEQSREMVTSVDYPVDVIIDMRNNKSVPPGALTHLRTISSGGSPNWRLGVFVGENSFIEILVKLFIKVYPKFGERFVIAHSIEEAQAIIAGKQAGTKPIPAD